MIKYPKMDKLLKKHRDNHGMTKVTLSELSGITAPIIWNIERGSYRGIKLSTVIDFANAFNMTLNEFLEIGK